MVLLFDDAPISEYFTKLFDFFVDFQENNPKYRCIFQKAHVLNVAKVLLWIEIFVAIPLYVLFLFPWWLIWIGVHFILLLITIYAIRKKKHRFMWPIIFFSMIQFLIWFAITFVQLFFAVFDTQAFLNFYSQGHHEDWLMRVGAVLIIKAVVISIAALLFWRLTIFYATKNYFSDRTEGQVSVTGQSKGMGGVAEKLLQPV